MAHYPYLASDGSELLIEAPMSAPPKIGHTLRRGGKRYTRVPVVPGSKVFHFASHQLPLGYKYASRWKTRTGRDGSIVRDEQGRAMKGEPAFDSMAEVRQMMAKANAAGEELAWD